MAGITVPRSLLIFIFDQIRPDPGSLFQRAIFRVLLLYYFRKTFSQKVLHNGSDGGIFISVVTDEPLVINEYVKIREEKA